MKKGSSIVERYVLFEGNRKVTYRRLFCGHKVREPSGGKAKAAKWALCSECPPDVLQMGRISCRESNLDEQLSLRSGHHVVASDNLDVTVEVPVFEVKR